MYLSVETSSSWHLYASVAPGRDHERETTELQTSAGGGGGGGGGGGPGGFGDVESLPNEGPITVCEPACGSGVMILSIAEACPPAIRRRLR